jgi:hypothetical protein
VHAWLRSGNTASARGAEEFLEETLALLPEGRRIRFLRGDLGFDQEPFLWRVEDRDRRRFIGTESGQKDGQKLFMPVS